MCWDDSGYYACEEQCLNQSNFNESNPEMVYLNCSAQAGIEFVYNANQTLNNATNAAELLGKTILSAFGIIVLLIAML